MGNISKITPAKFAKALGLLAEGKTQAEAAKSIGTSARSLVRAIAADPQSKQVLSDLRRSIRTMHLERIRLVNPKVYEALDKALEAGDFKGVDQVARAIRALEVTAASAGPQEPKSEPVSVQIAVMPGWSKAGDGAGMATVQTVPQATVVEVKPKPVETPQSAALAKMKAMHQARELD